MAKCDCCGTSIIFGGVHAQSQRYCSENCAQQVRVNQFTDAVPTELLQRYIQEVHQGDCPKCGGPGPIDVHFSHTVWSALIVTSSSSQSRVCCQGCGAKAKLGAMLSSAALGWWGMPWGLIFTPIQIMRNLGGILIGPDRTKPSPELMKLVKANLAAGAYRSRPVDDVVLEVA